MRTVRSECLDHLLIVNKRHLERVLRTYCPPLHGHRPHQGIGQGIPERRPPPLRSLEPGESADLDATSVVPCGDATGWVA